MSLVTNGQYEGSVIMEMFFILRGKKTKLNDLSEAVGLFL